VINGKSLIVYGRLTRNVGQWHIPRIVVVIKCRKSEIECSLSDVAV
jgi:hypothetical protein